MRSPACCTCAQAMSSKCTPRFCAGLTGVKYPFPTFPSSLIDPALRRRVSLWRVDELREAVGEARPVELLFDVAIVVHVQQPGGAEQPEVIQRLQLLQPGIEAEGIDAEGLQTQVERARLREERERLVSDVVVGGKQPGALADKDAVEVAVLELAGHAGVDALRGVDRDVAGVEKGQAGFDLASRPGRRDEEDEVDVLAAPLGEL